MGGLAVRLGLALICAVAPRSSAIKVHTLIERDALRAVFNDAKASSPVLGTIGSDVDGWRAKTHGTLARELALISKAGLIDTSRGNIRIVDLAADSDQPLAEAAE